MLYIKDRDNIVTEAQEWLNTPYKGWGRAKYWGCDCLGFVAGVFVNCGYISDKEADAAIPKSYSLQIGQHMEDTEYIDGLGEFMREIPEHEVRAGDVAMYKIALAFSHSAIVVKWPLIIHALAHGGVKHADGKRHPLLLNKPVRFFTLDDERCAKGR
jgi:cell wall-associated NlpC family hydrolase